LNREEFNLLIQSHGLGDVSDSIIDVARKCVRFEADESSRSKPAVGKSKVGGDADLAEDFEWPARDGKSLLFLAQIALSEIPPIGEPDGLPSSGWLSFFYDAHEQPWGYDPKHAGSAAVIYTPFSKPLVRREMPDEISEEAFGEYRLMPIGHYSLPSWDRAASHLLELSETEMDAYEELRSELNSEYPISCHQLLGWPDEIQGPMELECQLVTNGLYCGNETGYRDKRAAQLADGADDWQLLFQLDSDDKADMMWGDAGRLYYWIRKQELARQSFDNTWTILQCF
jgi:uncharacterized protein YwqG